MIDTSIFNKNNIYNEDIAKCRSQLEDSDCILCRTCQHFSICAGLAFRTIMKRLNSKENNNETT